MLRKQKKLINFGILIIAFYLCNYFFFLIFVPNGLFIKQWFSFALLFISFYLYYKTVLFKSDSSFYLANTLVLSFILMLVQFYKDFTFIQIWPFFIFISAIPYFINFVCYKSKYQGKLFILTFLLFLVASLLNFLLIL